MNLQPAGYIHILESLKEKIRYARIKAAVAVNTELLVLYWKIGNSILQQQQQEGWGTKVTSRLARDLWVEFLDMKGLSERNLVYMQTFAAAWPGFVITQASLAETAARKKSQLLKHCLRKQVTVNLQYTNWHSSPGTQPDTKLLENLYHELPGKTALEDITEKIIENILD